MAIFKFVVLKAQKNSEGECVVKLRVQHGGERKYISTNVRIRPENFASGRCTGLGSGPKQRDLDRVMLKILDAYDKIDCPSGLTCQQLIDVLNGVSPVVKKKPVAVALRKRRSMLDVCHEYIDSREKESTRRTYRDALVPWTSFAGESFLLEDLTPQKINAYIQWLKNYKPKKKGSNGKLSPTTIHILSNNLKVMVNYGIKMGYAKYDLHPWVTANVPHSNVRHTDITVEQLIRIRDLDLSECIDHANCARDAFLLTYYLCGMNMIDIIKVDWRQVKRNDGVLEYVRQKTENRKFGNNVTAFTVQPEAWAIIEKYIKYDGRIRFGKYGHDGTMIKMLNRNLKDIGEMCGIDRKTFTLYVARHTFMQHGFDLGIPLSTLEYCVGQTMKENRPIFNYVRVMKKHADEAQRKIFDNLLGDMES